MWRRFSRGSPPREGYIEVSNWVQRCADAFVSQEKIMGIESELFIPNLKDPKLIDLVSENIGRIADGSSSHCGGALKLGLKKAVEFKKLNKGVQLRCPRGGCPWYTTPTSYSNVGGNVYCPSCVGVRGSYYLQCVGCGCQRTSAYTSCQNCKKRFA